MFFRLAYGVVPDAQAAEDACQQAMMKAWEARGTIRDRQSLRSWLARTVVNESLVVLRRRRVERRAVALEALVRPTEAGPGHARLEAREAVEAALAELPEDLRIVVELRVMQGLKGENVKELLGVSGAEVSRRLHRGMERLRELLADVPAGDAPAGEARRERRT